MSDGQRKDYTTLLPPVMALRILWARTGSFSSNVESKLNATISYENLKDIRDRADASDDERERTYVSGAIATIDAGLRNLDIIYKGRELNFEENEKIRSAHLKTIQENIDFGNKLVDVVKSLPALLIGAASGITLIETVWEDSQLSDGALALITGAFAGIGYLINLYIVRRTRTRKVQLYIGEDYERNQYYEQYVFRVEMALRSLYNDLDGLHQNVFGQKYPENRTLEGIIDDILMGIRPTFCKYLHKHREEDKIDHKVWAKCESGNIDAVQQCPYWEG